MKIQIIQLEQHDDVLSARDKLGWKSASKILLVLPERNKLFQNKLDQQIILRHAKNLGAQIAFVTKDKFVILYAKELAIPTFRSITQATKSDWSIPDFNHHPMDQILDRHARFKDLYTTIANARTQPRSWLNSVSGRIAIFFLGILAVFALVFAILPTAKVVLHPDSVQQRFVFKFSGNPHLDNIRLTGGVPITKTVIRLSGEKSQKTSGKIRIPLSIAAGEVTLTNLTDHEVNIPQGSIVTTVTEPLHRYQITQNITIPAGPGKTVIAPVKALIPGSTENISANAIQALEGVLGLEATATNPDPITGGEDQPIAAVSASDQERLLTDLKKELTQKAREQVFKTLAKNDLLLDDQPVQTSVISARYTPDVNQPSDTVQLALDLEVIFPIAQGEHLQQLTQQLLDANHQAGYQPVSQPIQFHCLTPVQKDMSGNYTCEMEASRVILRKINLLELQDQILLRPLPIALNKIQTLYPFQKTAQIIINPSWWKFTPALPMRITFEIAP